MTQGFRAGWKNRRTGQVMPMVALIIAVLLGFAALGIDIFMIYWAKSNLQRATDAAAIAGATYLSDLTFSNPNAACTYSTQAEQAACTYALSNGVLSSEIQSIAISSDSRSITVTTSRIVPAYFARLLGYTQFTVNATATATIQSIGSANEVIPVGLDWTTPYTYGQQITMIKSGGGSTHWNALSPCGSGGANVRDSIANGVSCTPPVAVGDLIDIKQGATEGPIRQGFQSRIDAGNSIDPAGTWDSHAVNNPRAATMMLVDWPSGRQASVKGFAEVWIVAAGKQGQVDIIFIRQVTSGEPGGTIDAGAMHVTLVQ